MGSFSFEHGPLKLCLVRYYPDAFYFFNMIASWGSYISGSSVIIFIWVLIDALLPKKTVTGVVASNNHSIKQVVSSKTICFDKFSKF